MKAFRGPDRCKAAPITPGDHEAIDGLARQWSRLDEPRVALSRETMA